MKCEEVRDELVAYVRGELDPSRRSEIEEHLTRCRGCTSELEDARRVVAVLQMADELPTIKIAQTIVQEAIRRLASDIHIEGMPHEGPRIRFRIDGALQPYEPEKPISADLFPALVARIKIMAEMNVSERSLPQDGRIPVRTREGKDFDLRVSVVPNINGENIVMRILDRNSVLIGLGGLGLDEPRRQVIQKLIHQPNGMVVAAGPNGSGKSTLLYSILNELNDPGIKILTIEDPVEYAMTGVTQIPVNRKKGLTFAAGLRSIMRQDPDVLMVGEVRDLETAELCLQASLTGHLILTALHPSDSIGAISRLLEIGLEPFAVASALTGIVAQRLTRTICPHCKAEYEPARVVAAAMELPAGTMLSHGAGCDQCRLTGYKGRNGFFETLIIDEALQEMIVEKAPASALRKTAAERGLLLSFADDARAKILAGVTTFEEATRSLHGIFP
ncbi:MAG: Flp pilus assembly complex ATPase component TadA, partial [Chloroflexi bacterium]|nr:Flp pilus assembly complex ATPase component TadA [Chloroflexota bacterium]